MDKDKDLEKARGGGWRTKMDEVNRQIGIGRQTDDAYELIWRGPKKSGIPSRHLGFTSRHHPVTTDLEPPVTYRTSPLKRPINIPRRIPWNHHEITMVRSFFHESKGEISMESCPSDEVPKCPGRWYPLWHQIRSAEGRGHPQLIGQVNFAIHPQKN